MLPQLGRRRYAGVYAMDFGGSPVVSAPLERLSEVEPRLRLWTSATVRDAEEAGASLAPIAGEVIGPAYLGYADAGALRDDGDGPTARILGERDAPALERLRESCPSADWEHGGSSALDPKAGSFAGQELAAVAGYEIWGARIAHIAVVTHPRHRGRGHARAAVAVIARHAIESQLVLQYRTLESNAPSRRIADALGFVHLATSLAVRFA